MEIAGRLLIGLAISAAAAVLGNTLADPKVEAPTPALLETFRSHDIVMLGETHGNRQEYDWLRSLVANPAFADTVDDIPCSPQRTWAENGFFQCFHSMRNDLCSWPQFVSPHSKSVGRAAPRLFRPMVPDFLHGAPPTAAYAAFIKESRVKFVNTRELDRKSGCTLRRTWCPVQNRRP